MLTEKEKPIILPFMSVIYSSLEKGNNYFRFYTLNEDIFIVKYLSDAESDNGLDLEELNNEITKNIHKEKENINEVIKSLKVEKEKITNKITMLYNDRCDGVISANVYKELASSFELKLNLA